MSSLHKFKNVKPTDLPVPPQAAVRILEACSGDDIDSHQLSVIISSDPMLTAELLRTVNSAFYAMSREVTTIAQAITIIGQRALRNIVLCIMVRDVLRNQSGKESINISGYLDDMLRRAVCARCLGEMVGLDPNECFTIGILQDIGLMVMFLLCHNTSLCGNNSGLQILRHDIKWNDEF